MLQFQLIISSRVCVLLQQRGGARGGRALRKKLMWPDPSGTNVDSTLTYLNPNLNPSVSSEYSWLLFKRKVRLHQIYVTELPILCCVSPQSPWVYRTNWEKMCI